MYLGNTFLFNGYLISSFSLILIVVLILYYIVSKRIRIPTSNSHLKGFTEISVFSYKASLLKKVYKLRRPDTNDLTFSFRREQISQFIEQANNHHASNVKFTKRISEKKIFISRYNCVQRNRVLKHVNSWI